MNQIQKLSRKVLTDRLKLQLGLAPEVDVDFKTLRSMTHQVHVERMMKTLKGEGSRLSAGNY
jgi:hypothetical protein